MAIKLPIIKLTANSKPLTEQVMARLLSLDITDNAKLEADELAFTLDDHDGNMPLPKRGALIECFMGYADTGMVSMGVYAVTTSSASGTPDVVKVKAKSADFKGSLKASHSQSYHDKTLGDIASQVANRHGLQLKITPQLASKKVAHIDQTQESDLHFITRLAWLFGGSVTIKFSNLIVYSQSNNVSISGQPLALTTITRSHGDRWSFDIEDRQGSYTGVKASYQDKAGARRKTVSAGNPEKRGGKDDAHTKTKHLKGTFKNEQEAQEAANAELQRITNHQAKFSIALPYGYPSIKTEQPIKLSGWKTEIDALSYTVNKATHNYTKSNGLTTKLELIASTN